MDKEMALYSKYLEDALHYAQTKFTSAPIEHQRSFANSVAHALTGMTGGYGGPSMREHLAARKSSRFDRLTSTFKDACKLLEACCFGPITDEHAKIFVIEHCFHDTEEDTKTAEEIAFQKRYYQMFS